ncbi:MAG: imelysin family protein [Myxococcota bacterium]
MIFLFLSCTYTDLYETVLHSLGDTVFLPNYSNVSIRSGELEKEIVSYCESPETYPLDSVQMAWRHAREPWKKMEFLNIGPFKEPNRLGYQIDFWPVRVETLEEVLYGQETLSNDTILDFPAATKGFPAIEWLIFSEIDRSRPRFCQFLEATAYDLHYHTTELYNAWRPEEGNYLSHLTEAGEGKDYQTAKDAMTEIVNKLGHSIANIRALKLVKPLGDAQGIVQSELLESRYSQDSLRDIRSNLKGIANVYYGMESGLGVKNLIPVDKIHITNDFELYLSESLEAIDALDTRGSLEETMLIDPSGVDYLSARLEALQSFIQIDLLLALSFLSTFNDSDGD